MHIGNKEVVVLQVGEKGIQFAQLKITATGPGGHGSVYHKTNPIARVGEIAHEFHTMATRLPLHANIANESLCRKHDQCPSFL